MVDMTEVHAVSNNLYSMGYDPEAQEMHVRFLQYTAPTEPGGPRGRIPGAWYIYSRVPQGEYDTLKDFAVRNAALLAEGKGAERSFTGYFNELIKDHATADGKDSKYGYRKVTEDNPRAPKSSLKG